MTAPRSRSRAPRGVALIAVLTLLLSAACGDDPSGPGSDQVSTIVISGLNPEPLRVGSTAQLAATALSETGSVINGASMTWKSSDAAVATVSGSGLLTAAGAGTTTVTATSGGGSGTAEVFVVAPLTLGPLGGTVSLPDGSISLTAPPGELAEPITFLVGPAPTPLDDPVPGTTVQIRIEGETPDPAPRVTLSLRYSAAQLPPGVRAGDLQLHAYTLGAWAAIRGSGSDPAEPVVSGTIRGPGLYAVRPTPVAGVVMTGALIDGALYVGQNTELGAAALTAAGDTLRAAELDWTTSDAGVATVDDDGTVTAVGTGSVTISVASGIVGASTQLEILPRPVASWPGPTEWSTYRGNNRRTGYVDATLDPVAFATRWEVTLPAESLNEPATGDGNVYLSTNRYFGGQALWALDATSGAVRWTHAFGDIHSVNGPAASDGRVYVSTGGHSDSFLWSFDAADGTMRFRSPYGNQWSRWPAPAISEGTVFLGGGYYGGMAAFTASDGAQLWTLDLPQVDSWTPAAQGSTAYAFNAGGLIKASATGDTTLHLADLGIPVAGTPVVEGEFVFAIDAGRLIALDLTRDAIAWSLPGRYQGIPAIDDTYVYAVVNDQVEARDRRDGSLAWSWAPPAESTAWGSVVVTRNLLFVRVNDDPSARTGRVIALDLQARRPVWSYEGAGQIVLGNGLLVLLSPLGGTVTAIEVE